MTMHRYHTEAKACRNLYTIMQRIFPLGREQ